jgi:hypothetical protein
MPTKEPTNDKRFLTFVQKKLKLTKKEIAESEQWIDGFKTAVNSCEKIGMFPEWQPIETLPKEHVNFLGFLPCNFIGFPEVMQLNTEHTQDIKDFGVTHWMPLPKPPTQK